MKTQIDKKIVIGLMSGTSLDGLDIAACEFVEGATFSFNILACETIRYSESLLNKLSSASNCSGRYLIQLHHEYGKYLGNAVLAFEEKNNLKADLISSHGHTVFHNPAEGYTFQLGSAQDLFALLKQDVVADFRSADIALGGQGAPLVPIGDKLLFSEFDACLNLGGFANVSYESQDKRIAFDICPLNIPLNQYATREGLPFDKGGQLAAKGELIPSLLEKLLKLPFFAEKAPKSLGREWYENEFFPLLMEFDASTSEDILRTIVELQVIAISESIPKSINKVLVTGGGAWNDFLIRKLDERRPDIWHIPDESIVNFKEALIFAFLGWLRLNNRVNCLSSVTGASQDHSSGIVLLNK